MGVVVERLGDFVSFGMVGNLIGLGCGSVQSIDLAYSPVKLNSANPS